MRAVGLPADRRLRRGPEITAVVRRGRRVRAGGLVVHGSLPAPGPLPGDVGPATSSTRPSPAGPRVAFVAPRTCGPAVRRNRTRRRVQELLRGMVATGALRADVDLVVRFLPEATDAAGAELAGWLGTALRRLGVTS